MSLDAAEKLFKNQRQFFLSGKTRSHKFRLEALEALEETLNSYEEKMIDALRADLGRPRFEAIAGELQPSLNELKYFLKNLNKLLEPRPASQSWLSISHFGSRSFLLPEPLGTSLVISPWNYPIYLSLCPVIGSIASGNSVLLKPSEFAPASASCLEEIIKQSFAEEHVGCVQGGAGLSAELCSFSWDKIFFTGSTSVGKKVMKAAAENLSNITLELGGKSPCIFDEEVDLQTATRRCLWAKAFNAGQTCVAPDHVILPETKLQEFLKFAESYLSSAYPEGSLASPEFSKIINQKHFERLKKHLLNSKVLIGGGVDESSQKIEMSIVESPIDEEVFGPILPVSTYKNFDDLIQKVRSQAKPLALYFFSKNPERQRRIIQETTSGGVVINDCLVHLTHNELAFGGVGESGFGRYHKAHSIDCFSHLKSVEMKSLWPDFKLRYPPYKTALNRLKRLFL